jgi:hypothetical protein
MGERSIKDRCIVYIDLMIIMFVHSIAYFYVHSLAILSNSGIFYLYNFEHYKLC